MAAKWRAPFAGIIQTGSVGMISAGNARRHPSRGLNLSPRPPSCKRFLERKLRAAGSALVAARRLCLRRPAMPHDNGGDILALAQTLGHGRGFVGGAVAAGPNREPVAAIMIAVVGDRHGIAFAVELLGELARIRLARE